MKKLIFYFCAALMIAAKVSATYVANLPTSPIIVNDSSTPITLVFVANTHDGSLTWDDVAILADMKEKYKTISAETDCYNSTSTPKDLVLSGTYQGTVISGTRIPVTLYRNIARIDFTIHNSSYEAITLNTIQLCNVPTTLYYAPVHTNTTAILPASSAYINYPAEPITDAAINGAQTITWYMPINQRGTSTSTVDETKPSMSPANATYLLVSAQDVDGNFCFYRFYLGTNLQNNYNLSANCRYIIDMTIYEKGDPATDSRVGIYEKVDLINTANSYILNPPAVGGTIYTFPVRRLNDFWPVVDATMAISASDTWTAELIWQDTPESDLIRFVDFKNGEFTSTLSGTGLQSIAVVVLAGYEGNAMIGLKKTGKTDYSWSWHLWITDYNPTYTAPTVSGQYVYPVTGGKVHRYAGAAWTTGSYKDKYIMDRNLGARDANYNLTGLLCYQFGRKDPFPVPSSGAKLYDINGVEINYSNENYYEDVGTVGTTLAEGVKKPNKFFCNTSYVPYSSMESDWTSEGKTGTFVWNNTVSGVDLKSLFDPCPLGWKLPVTAGTTWSDFTYNASNAAASTVINANRDAKLGWTAVTNMPGLRYWPIGSTVPTDPIYYPAYGNLNIQKGNITGNGDYVYCWASTPASATAGEAFTALHTTTEQGVTAANPGVRMYGFPVRCVQE